MAVSSLCLSKKLSFEEFGYTGLGWRKIQYTVCQPQLEDSLQHRRKAGKLTALIRIFRSLTEGWRVVDIVAVDCLMGVVQKWIFGPIIFFVLKIHCELVMC